MTRISQIALATIALVAVGTVEAHAQLPAFPGAEGFGAIATGGRGGRVLRVTTLASSGAGSLQAALDVCEPRMIVFTVSGVIEGDHAIPCGDVTIAGQTAPGAGITIHGRLIGEYDYSVGNLIIRHIRVRPPPLIADDPDLGPQYDAIQLSRQRRFILDHVTASWGSDETIDFYEAQDATLQWSSIEESSLEGQPEGPHNFGFINGPDGGRVTVHHVLCAHQGNRCPAVATGPAEVANMVVYDTRHGFVHHNPAQGEIHIIGNTYRDGPSAEIFPFYFDDEQPGGTMLYLRDNYVDDPGVFTGEVDDIWAQPYVHPTFENAEGAAFAISSPTDFAAGNPGYVPLTLQPPLEAYDLVVARAGAFPRDAVSLRTIADVTGRTGSWGASPPVDLMAGLTAGTPPLDADADGMADAWELEQGYDPGDSTDHAIVTDSGYTRIEKYINELADALTGAPPGPGPDVDAGLGDGPGDDDGSGGGCCQTGGGGGGAGGSLLLALAVLFLSLRTPRLLAQRRAKGAHGRRLARCLDESAQQLEIQIG